MADVRRSPRAGKKIAPTPAAPSRRDWLESLRTAFADADAVARDMLRPPRERGLGPVNHRDLYEEAHGKIAALLGATVEPGQSTLVP